MNRKIVVPILCVALMMGMLSGCVEEEPTPPANNAPVAVFTVGIVNMTATFTDGSTDADIDTLTYSWDFGDEGTSEEASPIHTYAENGTYTVTLTVSDGTSDDATDPLEIIVGNVAPTAIFSSEVTNLTVVFTDESTDPNGDDTITEWLWDFGDDNTNTTQNPTYTYTAAGIYNVTLTVADDYGLTDITEIIPITVTAEE